MPAEVFTVFPLARVTINAGTATREWTFSAPVNCEIFKVEASADASDGTDYITWTVEHPNGTVIVTLAAVQAADTITSVTTVDAGDVNFIARDGLVQVISTFTGTAANVLGAQCTVWARSKR